MRAPELSDGTVTLRVHREEDIEGVYEQCQDAESIRWTTVPQPYPREAAEHWVTEVIPRGWADGTSCSFAIIETATGRFCGGLDVRPQDPGAAELGYGLGPWARGKGLMTRALRLAVDWAFSPSGLDMDLLRWEAHVGNWPSRRVAWRLGIRIEGTVRGLSEQRGELRDAWIGTLRRDDPGRPARPWFDVPTLRGDAVMLRRWRDSDADAAVEGCTDPVTRQWLGGLPDPYTRETALEYIASREEDHASGRGVHWAAALDERGTTVGSFSLMGVDDGHGPGSAEVGYWVHPDARGKGVATEAVRLMVSHAFAPVDDGGLGLRRLVLAHAAGNDASRVVALRNGFARFGVERQAERLGDGSYADLHWYEHVADR